MDFFNTWLTLPHFLLIYPWVLNAMSLTGAYCLSNSKVIFGRYVGACAAVGWAAYGVLISEWSFLVANVVFCYIYVSAIYKFNRKRDEYKASFEEQAAEIARLQKALTKNHEKSQRILDIRETKLQKLAEEIRSQSHDHLRAIEDIVSTVKVA
jgi:hypothetical protein